MVAVFYKKRQTNFTQTIRPESENIAMPHTNAPERKHFPRRRKPCSMIGAYVLLGSGLWLLMPWQTFTGTSPLYAFMSKVPGNENTWGVTLIIFAIPRLWIEYRKRYHLRLGTTIFSMIGLLFLAGITYSAAPKALLFPILLINAIFTAGSAREIEKD